MLSERLKFRLKEFEVDVCLDNAFVLSLENWSDIRTFIETLSHVFTKLQDLLFTPVELSG